MNKRYRSITAKKEEKLKEKLKQSEMKYRNLIENNHDIIFNMDENGIFTFVSPVWEELLGHKISEVLGKSFIDFIHPIDIERSILFFQQSITQKKVEGSIEYRVKSKDGKLFWHLTNAKPIIDKAGNIKGFTGTARDITERKKIEAKLKENEEYQRLLFENLSIGIIIVDPKTRIIETVNTFAAKIIGSSVNDIVGKRCHLFIANFEIKEHISNHKK